MVSYIDIHAHLLYGLDDGAKDFETSMQMFRIAEKNNIGKIILTPHYKPMRHNASPGKIAQMITHLDEQLKKEGIDIQLLAGNEIYYHSEAVTKLEEKKACTMAASDYVLVEFSPMDEFEYIRNGIYQVMAGGYRPILAHAERYECIARQIERVDDLIQMGCYIQLNAGSVMGQFGFATKQFARKLLKQQKVHFVATDAHDTAKRAPNLNECARYISKKYDDDYTRMLLYENPLCIIQNKYI